MSYKSMVVSANNSDNDRVLNTAAAMAAQFDAHLSGTFVYEPFYYNYPAAYGVDLTAVMSNDRHAAKKEAEAAKIAFEKACSSCGVDHTDWQFDEGELLMMLNARARYADVIFMTQTQTGRSSDLHSTDRDLPAKVAIASGRPVIAVPCVGEGGTLGKRVLVAWNGSREATRAVREALPLLHSAKQVFVLAINPDTRDYRGFGEEPGADIALYLSRHGVNVEVMTTVSGAVSVADTLLSSAADLDVDLICMGAYGHSRLRELALGGVTWTIMREMTVPVLLAQ
ncbi:MAG: universal stress protein [Salinisphaera sp.]|jgi:nucleotide-binding universal stress UspA family protein|nr:universal stress protein [Salinisphaera sp.]